MYSVTNTDIFVWFTEEYIYYAKFIFNVKFNFWLDYYFIRRPVFNPLIQMGIRPLAM